MEFDAYCNDKIHTQRKNPTKAENETFNEELLGITEQNPLLDDELLTANEGVSRNI